MLAHTNNNFNNNSAMSICMYTLLNDCNKIMKQETTTQQRKITPAKCKVKYKYTHTLISNIQKDSSKVSNKNKNNDNDDWRR